MDNRKEIEELIALYSLEPNLKDIYVEGTFDKHLLDWFLLEQNISGVSVYTIDTINVPDDLMKRYDLSHGSNRSRLIALSNEFSSMLKDCRILCIADRDHEDYFPTGHMNTYLKLTDYTSSDLYLFQQRTVRKMITLVLGGFPISTEELMRELIDVLEEVFLIRLSNAALKWCMHWIPFVRYVHIDGHFMFNIDGFIKSYLQKNARWKQREESKQTLSKLRAGLKENPRHRIRGHDLIDLLHYSIKKLKKSRRFGNVNTLHGVFAGCLEVSDIQEERLFQYIAEL